MTKKITDLYNLSCKVSDYTWQVVQFWSVFNREIIGQHLLKAVDEASINIGKASIIPKLEVRQKYLNISLENLIDTNLWLDKARRRNLINNKDYKLIFDELKKLESVINHLLTGKPVSQKPHKRH